MVLYLGDDTREAKVLRLTYLGNFTDTGLFSINVKSQCSYYPLVCVHLPMSRIFNVKV